MQEPCPTHGPGGGPDRSVEPCGGPGLDADEQRTWRAFLAATRLISERVERGLWHEARMPHAYYDILVLLADAPGRAMRMGELATRSASSRSRLSHAVARLEESGLVVRRASPDDRRATFAEITDDGLRVLAAATPGYLRTVRAVLFDAVTEPQRAALRDVAETLVAHLAAADRPVSGRSCRTAP